MRRSIQYNLTYEQSTHSLNGLEDQKFGIVSGGKVELKRFRPTVHFTSRMIKAESAVPAISDVSMHVVVYYKYAYIFIYIYIIKYRISVFVHGCSGARLIHPKIWIWTFSSTLLYRLNRITSTNNIYRPILIEIRPRNWPERKPRSDKRNRNNIQLMMCVFNEKW